MLFLCVQIKVLPAKHNCPTTKLREWKMATQGWCADRLGDWVKRNPTKGPTNCKDQLEGDYGIKLSFQYKLGQCAFGLWYQAQVLQGMVWLKVALEQIHGKYEESF